MAILEALAARLPALVTTTCHFPELQAARGAITVEPNARDVTSGLRELLQMSPRERSEMADRGRGLVESQYTWDRQAQRLTELYRWLDRGGADPSAIVAARGMSA
jgi:glycosyltransferase involved in cell wall biosynthesis